jgi:BlaI family transcriptional regulator, penicillinase repressor
VEWGFETCMAKKIRKVALSELQLAAMRVVWTRGEATIADVVSDLECKRGLAHTTVATLLLRLEKRGLLAKRKEGRAYVYTALVTESDVKRSMVADLIASLFQGDSQELLAHLVRSEEISATDLAKVRSRLKELDRG